MESYEDFIQRYYNGDHGDAEDEPRTPVTSSSLIVFHGARILPPVVKTSLLYSYKLIYTLV